MANTDVEDIRHRLFLINEFCDSGQIDRAIAEYISVERICVPSHPLYNQLITVRLHLFASVKRLVHKLLAPDSMRKYSRGHMELYMKFCGMDLNELTAVERANLLKL